MAEIIGPNIFEGDHTPESCHFTGGVRWAAEGEACAGEVIDRGICWTRDALEVQMPPRDLVFYLAQGQNMAHAAVRPGYPELIVAVGYLNRMWQSAMGMMAAAGAHAAGNELPRPRIPALVRPIELHFMIEGPVRTYYKNNSEWHGGTLTPSEVPDSIHAGILAGQSVLAAVYHRRGTNIMAAYRRVR